MRLHSSHLAPPMNVVAALHTCKLGQLLDPAALQCNSADSSAHSVARHAIELYQFLQAAISF
jgi:hypothetical protein